MLNYTQKEHFSFVKSLGLPTQSNWLELSSSSSISGWAGVDEVGRGALFGPVVARSAAQPGNRSYLGLRHRRRVHGYWPSAQHRNLQGPA